MSPRRLLVLAAAALAAVAAGGGSRAGEPPSTWRPPVELRPMLRFGVSTTGARSYGTRIGASMQPAREDFQGFVITPGFPEPGSLCLNSLQVGISRENASSGIVSWLIEARLVDVRQDEATVDVRWTRGVNEPVVVPSDAFSIEQRFVLREGDEGVLDLVRAAVPAPGGCDSLALVYQFDFEGAESLTSTAIAYDVWLVQQDAAGAPITARFEATARQNQDAPYFFKPVSYAADGSRASAGAAVRMDVRGTVRGRVRPDGDIDLTIDAERQFMAINREGGGVAGTSSHGRTLVTVRPGETVETVIDPPSDARPLRGVESMTRAFGGHRTAVRITARRLW